MGVQPAALSSSKQASEEHDESYLVCPSCGSQALNKNGRIKTGKQRYLCLVCGRQFVLPSEKAAVPSRPGCPDCGKPMYVYARGPGFIRFRCADYPECKSYRKVDLKKG
jgi:DNA-directed RNA polymerase subunit RPC12/RpoP